MQHKFQWAHDGITHDYGSTSSQSSPVHFPAARQAADEIPRDNASGMKETNVFCLWQHSKGPEAYTKKFKTIKMSSATGRVNDNPKSVFPKQKASTIEHNCTILKQIQMRKVQVVGLHLPFFLKYLKKEATCLISKVPWKERRGKKPTDQSGIQFILANCMFFHLTFLHQQ